MIVASTIVPPQPLQPRPLKALLHVLKYFLGYSASPQEEERNLQSAVESGIRFLLKSMPKKLLME